MLLVSLSQKVFCLKGGLRQREFSPCLFNALWVVLWGGWGAAPAAGGGGGHGLVGWLVGGGGVAEAWRCEGGGVALAVVEGRMTDQPLRNNYLHKIPSPFSFGEGQREGEKREGGGGVGRQDSGDGM